MAVQQPLVDLFLALGQIQQVDDIAAIPNVINPLRSGLAGRRRRCQQTSQNNQKRHGSSVQQSNTGPHLAFGAA
jgi:hypothetical protein